MERHHQYSAHFAHSSPLCAWLLNLRCWHEVNSRIWLSFRFRTDLSFPFTMILRYLRVI